MNTLPNTFIIGVQKAGTTTLHDVLLQHPEIAGNNRLKDFPFFVDDKFFSKGLTWFSKFFNVKNEKVILHAYVNYIFFNELFISRIKTVSNFGYGHPKFIVSLRNPIDRALSAYYQQLKMGYEDKKSFWNAIREEELRLKSNNWRKKADLTYITHGLYFRQLRLFYENFSKDQIKVIIFEEMLKDFHKAFVSLFDFLYADENFVPEFKRKNESGVPVSYKLQKAINRLTLPSFLKDIVPADWRITIKRTLRRINTKKIDYPKLLEEEREFLRKVFYDDVRRLEDLIDLDLKKYWDI